MKWFILTNIILMVCALVALVFSYWYVQRLIKLETTAVNNIIQEE